MDQQVIDFKVFAPKYRQALLYTMIEGLREGASFTFSDDRDPDEIERELAASGLVGYRWSRREAGSGAECAYVIERSPSECCGACGGHGHGSR